MLRNDAIAEELTQETFLKVFRVRESYVPDTDFAPWIFTIARHLCMDHLRKSATRLEKLSTFEGETEGPVDISTAEELLLEQARDEAFENCLSKLKESFREVLLLRVQAELSYQQIADELKVSLAAVKTTLFRAKEQLVGCLSRQDGSSR